MSRGRVFAVVLAAMIGAPVGVSAQIDFNKMWDDIKKAGERVEEEEGGGTSSSPPPPVPAPTPAPTQQSESTTGTAGQESESPTGTAGQGTEGGEVARYDRPWVREIQGLLKRKGHLAGAVDGIYGPGTQRSIRSYQRSVELEVTGLPTPSVMRSLRRTATARSSSAGETTRTSGGETASGSEAREEEETRAPAATESRAAREPSTTTAESTRTATRPAASGGGRVDLEAEARERLNRLGYDAGPGERMAQAVRAFQSDEDLPVDGRITPALVAALREAEGEDPNAAPPPAEPAPTSEPRPAPSSELGPAPAAPAVSATTTVAPKPAPSTRVATPPTRVEPTTERRRRQRLGVPSFDALYRLKLANGGYVAADETASALFHYVYFTRKLNVHYVYFTRKLNDRRSRTGDACRRVRAQYRSNAMRRELLATARRVYGEDLRVAQGGPASARFRLVFDVGFGRFDFAAGRFPFDNGLPRRYVMARDGNGCGRFRIGIPGAPERAHVEIGARAAIVDLPMTEGEAKALIRELKKGNRPRKLKLEVVIEATPIAARAPGFDFGARIVRARAYHPITNALLHEYDLTAPEQPAVVASGGAPAAGRTERILTEIRARRERCTALTDEREKVDCAERLCDYLAEQKGMGKTARGCRQKVQEAKRSLGRREQKSTRKERRCRDRFAERAGRPWIPAESSRSFRAAVEACAQSQPRRAGGPDIVGLRLGMGMGEARRILQDRTASRRVATLADARPFDTGELGWRRDGSRGIALFRITTSAGDRLAGVSRRLYFGRDRPDREDIEDGLRENTARRAGPTARARSSGMRRAAMAIPTSVASSRVVSRRAAAGRRPGRRTPAQAPTGRGYR